MIALDEQIARLDAEIANEVRDARRADGIGDTVRRDLSLARYDGLTFARTLLAGPADGCVHPLHEPAGVDENGRQLWRCATPGCGHVA